MAPFVKFYFNVPDTGIDHPLTEVLYLIWDLQISEANKNTHYAQLHTYAEPANHTRRHIHFPLLWGSNGKLIQFTIYQGGDARWRNDLASGEFINPRANQLLHFSM